MSDPDRPDLFNHTRHIERLFVLGAGFSRSVSDQFPVTSQLLERLFDEDPELLSLWMETSSYFGPFMRIHEANGTPEITAVLTALEAYRQSGALAGNADEKLRELQTRALYAATTLFDRVSRGLKTAPLLADFVKRLDPKKDAILTTNWDTSLELELERQKIPFQYDVLPAVPLLDRPEGLLVLKPQGSVGWYRVTPITPHTEPVLRTPRTNGCDWVLSQRKPPLPSFAKKGSADPAIVPPGYVGADRGSELDWSGYLLRVGTCAALQARNIVVVGYSLPPDDFHFLASLSFGIQQDSHGKPVNIFVIDPSPDAFARWRQGFQGRAWNSGQPISVRRWASSLEEALERPGGPWAR